MNMFFNLTLPVGAVLPCSTCEIRLIKDTALKHSYSFLAFLVINFVQISMVERQRT